MLRIPFLFNPLGWVFLGATGYLLYKAGKKAGREEREQEGKSDSSKKPMAKKPAAA